MAAGTATSYVVHMAMKDAVKQIIEALSEAEELENLK
jgi:hypothetical protein